MNLPLKKVTPLFLANPPHPSIYEIVQAPLLLQPPSWWGKSRFNNKWIFKQKDVSFFISPHNTGGQVLSGGTQQLIESGSDIKSIYQIPHFNLRKQRKK